jgi:DNA replicative helicase MCM subunit Mcm2 (Cdc46/Mcm family)
MTEENNIFLRKYIMYARTFNPVLNEESKAILHEYWSKLTDSPRILTLLHSMSKAVARLGINKYC